MLCTMKLHSILALVIGSAAIGAFLLGRPAWELYGPTLLINHTNSIPKGIYRLQSLVRWQYGTLVAFPAPKRLALSLSNRRWFPRNKPLVKPIGALPGDRVCIHGSIIKVNSSKLGPVFTNDFTGNSLPQRRGCFRVKSGHFLPLSTHSLRSFDGRYFGQISMRSARGQAIPILTWR